MCTDECDICVVLKLQAASPKLMRASLGLSAAVSGLGGIFRGPQPHSELSCPKSNQKSRASEQQGCCASQPRASSHLPPRRL